MQIWGEAEELILFSLKRWKKLRGDLIAVFYNLTVSYRVDTGKPAWRYTAKAQQNCATGKRQKLQQSKFQMKIFLIKCVQLWVLQILHLWAQNSAGQGHGNLTQLSVPLAGGGAGWHPTVASTLHKCLCTSGFTHLPLSQFQTFTYFSGALYLCYSITLGK